MPETENKQSNAPEVSVGQGGWWGTAISINSLHHSVRQRVERSEKAILLLSLRFDKT